MTHFNSLFQAADVIFAYTRQQAIEDGVLVDVTNEARQAGFNVPVALTAAVWADCVKWTKEDSAKKVHQDQSARLSDVLFMAYMHIMRSRGKSAELRFEMVRVPREGKSKAALPVNLKMMIGPGDKGEPVLTIMQPHED